MPKTFGMEDLRQRLQSRQHKMTPQRKEVLQIFLDCPGKHLSAEDVHDILRGKKSEIGLATVYRSLELLEGLGVLQKMDFGDGRSRYEINKTDPSAHHHHHMICTKCGSVTEFEDDLLENLEHDIEEKSGFHITNHEVKFFGYCRDCRKAQADA